MDKQKDVRVSFNMPADEHIMIKTECVKTRIPMKDYLHELVRIGWEQVKKAEFRDKMEKSLQQAKEGKVKKITSEDLDQWEKELENDA